MSAEGMGQTADLTIAGSSRWGGPANARERNFWIALGCALAFHALFLVSIARGKATHLGDPTGSDEAISVSLVTEADLKSRSTVAEPPDSPPAPPPQAATPPVEQPPKPPEPEAQQQPQTEAQPQPEAAPPQQQDAKQEEAKLEDSAPDLFSLQDQKPENQKSETKPKSKPTPEKSATSKPSAKKQQQKKTASLDLSTPPSFQQPSFSGGRSAAFQRPPGITRSGVNDAFARAVIRALQQTMPQLTGALGQVTVRIFLSESGEVVEVRLLAGAKDPTLNQDVVFAARQTSYPIPPVGSNVADRTFMVTYVYD